MKAVLARNYDNYAWEEQYQLPKADEGVKVKRAPVRETNRNLLAQISVIAFVIIATYLCAVVRSGTVMSAGNELVSLKEQEMQLINKNNELRIEVEQLKGPERIISIAESQLGMSVARSNIYVQAGHVKNNKVYALAGN